MGNDRDRQKSDWPERQWFRLADFARGDAFSWGVPGRAQGEWTEFDRVFLRALKVKAD